MSGLTLVLGSRIDKSLGLARVRWLFLLPISKDGSCVADP